MLPLLVRVFFVQYNEVFLLMRDNGPAYSWAPCQHVPPFLLTAGAVVAGAVPAVVQYGNTHTHTPSCGTDAHSFPTHFIYNDAHMFHMRPICTSGVYAHPLIDIYDEFI